MGLQRANPRQIILLFGFISRKIYFAKADNLELFENPYESQQNYFEIISFAK
jgi:hypothetical protein